MLIACPKPNLVYISVFFQPSTGDVMSSGVCSFHFTNTSFTLGFENPSFTYKCCSNRPPVMWCPGPDCPPSTSPGVCFLHFPINSTMPGIENFTSDILKKPKTGAERQRVYMARKRAKLRALKNDCKPKTIKTGAERQKAYKMRKAAEKLALKGSVEKPRTMPKKRSDYVIFEEPLINISMEPTEEEDPLFIDPTATISNEIEDELLNGFSIFSPKVSLNKKVSSALEDQEEKNEEIKIKKEIVENEGIKIKEEPKDTADFNPDIPKEEDIDPVEAFAKALDQVEFLCPKCTFRSTDKEDVQQHFVASHRIVQVGIPRPCDKCEFIGKTVRELGAHKRAAHPRTYIQDNLPTLPTGEFKCPHCDFTSFHRNNIRSHKKVHSQDTVYTCDKCPYTAISKLNIENHAARHLNKGKKRWKFKCKYCGLLEKTEKLLQRHLILHGEGEMVKCQLCPYKSPYNHIISMHTRICHGIVGKKSWEKEEKWKMRVRKSTRKCARKTQDYNEADVDYEEEFLELPMKRTNRGRKKKKCDNEQESSTLLSEDKGEGQSHDSLSSIDIKENENETPRRPTLEERLGRARELINKNLSRKKKLLSGDKDQEVEEKKIEEPVKTFMKSIITQNEEVNKKSDGENHSASDEENNTDENSENQSEDEADSKDEEEWSEEGSGFYSETAEESMQSFTSDKAPFKDSENSMTDSEGLSRAESADSKAESHANWRRQLLRSKRKRVINLKRSDNEKESSDNEDSTKRLKLGSDVSKSTINAIDENNTDNSQSDDNKISNDSNGGNKPDKKVEKDENNDFIDNIKNNETEHLPSNQDNANKDINHSEHSLDKISDNLESEEQDESAPARLVLKRNGSSFTCIPKSE